MTRRYWRSVPDPHSSEAALEKSSQLVIPINEQNLSKSAVAGASSPGATVGDPWCRVDRLKRLVGAQSLMRAKTIGSESESDRKASRIFKRLCHRMLQKCKKPVQLPRLQAEQTIGSGQTGKFIEAGKIDALRVEAGCDFNEFESICRVAKSRCSSCFFRPSFKEMQSATCEIGAASIAFDCSRGIGVCIGMSGASDLHSLVGKGRKVGEKKLRPDSALRLLGAALAFSENKSSPFVFRIGGSFDPCLRSRKAEFLWRPTRLFDYHTLTHLDPIKALISSTSAMIDEAGSCLQGSHQPNESRPVAFMMRWKRIAPPKFCRWSPFDQKSLENLGLLEMSWPCLSLRGSRTVEEVRDIATHEMAMRSLQRDDIPNGPAECEAML